MSFFKTTQKQKDKAVPAKKPTYAWVADKNALQGGQYQEVEDCGLLTLGAGAVLGRTDCTNFSILNVDRVPREKEEEDCSWLGKLGAAALVLGGATGAAASKSSGNKVAVRNQTPSVNNSSALPSNVIESNALRDAMSAPTETSTWSTSPAMTAVPKTIESIEDWENLYDETKSNYYSKLVDRNTGEYTLKNIDTFSVAKVVFKLPNSHPLRQKLHGFGDSSVVLKLYKKEEATAGKDVQSEEYKQVISWLTSREAAPKEVVVSYDDLVSSNVFPDVRKPNMKKEIHKLKRSAYKLSRETGLKKFPGNPDAFKSDKKFDEELEFWYEHSFLGEISMKDSLLNNAVDGKPSLETWRATKQRGVGIVAEFVTPVETFRTEFESIVDEWAEDNDALAGLPKGYVWSQVFAKDIKDNWVNLEADLINEKGVMIDDNHWGNWGMRVKKDWKTAVRNVLAEIDSTSLTINELDIVQNPDTQDVEKWRKTLTKENQNQLTKLSKRLQDATLTNTDRAPYGSLVAIDADRIIEDVSISDMEGSLSTKVLDLYNLEASYVGADINYVPTNTHLPWKKTALE